MVEQARLEAVDSGLAPMSDGWFVVNVRDAAWLTNDAFGARCVFESDRRVLRRRPDLDVQRFADVGFTLAVLQPRKPSGLYHAESNQENFLVLADECLLLVEGEERRLESWDFVHCPPGTEHAFVGAGDGPCVILMTGARTRDRSIVYPRSEKARRHGAESRPRRRRRRRRTPRSRTGSPTGPLPGTGSPGVKQVATQRPKHLVLILARELASNLATPTLIADDRGLLVFYNEAAEEIVGHTFAETGEVPLDDWTASFSPRTLDSEPLPAERRPARIALDERRPSHERFLITSRDGVDREVSVTAVPLFAHADEFVGIMAVFWRE